MTDIKNICGVINTQKQGLKNFTPDFFTIPEYITDNQRFNHFIDEAGFKNLSLDKQKKMFITMLDNNQMYVNKTEMADKKYGTGKEDRELTEWFYGG